MKQATQTANCQSGAGAHALHDAAASIMALTEFREVLECVRSCAAFNGYVLFKTP